MEDNENLHNEVEKIKREYKQKENDIEKKNGIYISSWLFISKKSLVFCERHLYFSKILKTNLDNIALHYSIKI